VWLSPYGSTELKSTICEFSCRIFREMSGFAPFVAVDALLTAGESAVRGGQFGKAGESPSVRGALNGHDYSGQSAGARLVNTGVGVASSSANAVFADQRGRTKGDGADQRGRGPKGDVAALLL